MRLTLQQKRNRTQSPCMFYLWYPYSATTSYMSLGECGAGGVRRRKDRKPFCLAMKKREGWEMVGGGSRGLKLS